MAYQASVLYLVSLVLKGKVRWVTMVTALKINGNKNIWLEAYSSFQLVYMYKAF